MTENMTIKTESFEKIKKDVKFIAVNSVSFQWSVAFSAKTIKIYIFMILNKLQISSLTGSLFYSNFFYLSSNNSAKTISLKTKFLDPKKLKF